MSDKKRSNKRKTTGQFIEEAKIIHGDRYDYSKTKYVKKDEKVIIACKIHGDFEQRAGGHIRGMGCPKCQYISNSEKFRCSNEEYIQKAMKAHGDRYDYSKTKYIKSDEKVIITCKIHGDFEQRAGGHTKGMGCPKCSGNHSYSTEEYIQKANRVHGDRYDYSKTKYVKSAEKIIITCKIHGDFEQRAGGHIRGMGCPKCQYISNSEKFRCSNEEYIQKAMKAHGDRYDYSKTKYIKSDEKVIITCKIHGDFEQRAGGHTKGMGCPKCSGNHSYSTEEYIQKANRVHGDRYDYSKTKYVKSAEKIIITCKIHGDFEQCAGSHIQGIGCPLCTNKTESKLYEGIVQFYPNIRLQFKQEWCQKKRALPFDFYIPEYNIIIELDGPQHFIQISNWDSPEEQFKNDKYKEKCANDNGFSIIRLLQEDVCNDTYNWLQELSNTIEEIKNHQIVHGDEILNIYLGEGYDKY